MKVIIESPSCFFLRFDRDEEVIQGIKKFCQEKQILAGTFTIIGAAKEILLAYYELKSKTYTDMRLEEDVEITGVTGNIATMEKEIVIHAHGTFSDELFRTYGGHVKKLIISATGEVAITVLQGPMQRKFDKKTGLNLFV